MIFISCCPLDHYWSLWQFPLCYITGRPNDTSCWCVLLINSRLVHLLWLGFTGPSWTPCPSFALSLKTDHPEGLPIIFRGNWNRMPLSLILAALWQNCWPSPQLSFTFLLKTHENFWEIGRQPLSQPLLAHYLVAHVVYRLH